MEKLEHRVWTVQGKQRLAAYLTGVFPPLVSRKGIKKAIKKGQVLLNGERVEEGRFVQEGDKIEYLQEKPRAIPKGLDIEVIYEDDFLAVVDKPAGIPVNGNHYRTLEAALPSVLEPSSEADALLTPRVMHRLDVATSGLVLVAKTAHSALHLPTLFAERKVRKVYEAIVLGKTAQVGELDFPISVKEKRADNTWSWSEAPRKKAQSFYRRLQHTQHPKLGPISLLQISPKTGRTHQLRIHLAELGHSIVGDAIYGPTDIYYLKKGLFLRASLLEFEHPFTGQILEVGTARANKFRRLMQS